MTHIGLLSTSSYDTDLLALLIQNGYVATKTQCSDHIVGIDIILIDKSKETDISKTIEYLIELREHQQLPIWVITKEYSEDEILIYLQLGANGVVFKSKGMKELLLTIRNYVQTTHSSCNRISEKVRDSFVLNPNKRVIIIDNNKEIQLTRSEFCMLEKLYKNINVPVTYEELFDYLWSDSSEKMIYRVANIVFHIRNKLPEDKKHIIKTVRSRGYVLELK